MSLWSDFVDTISVRAKETVNTALQSLSNIAGGFAGGTIGQQLTPDKPQLGDAVVRQNVQQALYENKKFDINQKQKSNDLILKGAIQLNEKVLSPLNRTVSTAALLSDTNSPLYQAGEYEKGFQVSDIKRAIERSKNVSSMQALTKSDLIPLVGPISSAVLSTGKIKIDDVNLWNDADIQKNFSDNVVGKYYTGFGDFFLGNAVIGKAAKLIGSGAKWAARSSGVSTTGKTAVEFEKDINDGFAWADSNGKVGQQTRSAAQMQELADSKDYGIITDIVSKYSTNANLIPLLYNTTSKEIARDLILADKGSISAMERLAKTAPSDLFELADVSGQIKAQTLLSGKVFVPEGPAVQRLQDAFEHAIQKNPQMDELRKVFLDDNYNPKVGGRVDYFPAEPKIAKGAFIKADKTLRSFKNNIAYRDLDNFSTIASAKLGTRVGGLTTEVVKFAARGTGYKPIGFVTFSGVRPLDGHVELRAFLNDLDLFKDGSRMIEIMPNQFKKAADVVRDFESRYINAGSQINQVKALEEIDAEIGKLIAYSNKYYLDSEIKAQIAAIRTEMTRQMSGFQKNAYAVNHDGSFIHTNAQTLRQLAESYQFTPWNIIERELGRAQQGAFKAGPSQSAAIAKSFYEDLSRFWTFDVLARPMFIMKQSIAEPLISVGIAQGIELSRAAVKTVAMRGLYNARNKIRGTASRIYNRTELKEINQAVSDKQQSLMKATAIKDMLQAEREALVSSGSPALREQHIAQVQKELRAAEKLVDELELDLHNATVPFGVKESIPSMSLLERRIAWIQNNTTTEEGARLASRIANAKAAIGQYKGTINSLAINTKAIQDAEDALAKAYDDIDNYVQDLSIAQKTQADLFGRSAKFKRGYLGKTSQYRMVNGQWVSIDSFVNDELGNNFARAMRAEVSNARTTEMNYIGELSVGTRKAMIQRKVPNSPITPMSPLYYEELSYVANNLIRRDPLMDLILAEKSPKELYQWSLTSEGRSYLQHFGVTLESQVPAYIDEKIALINRMFPSVEARAAILNREVTAQELQSMLAKYTDRLFQINPTDWSYGDRVVFGKHWYTGLENAMGTATSKIFRALTSPENPIRETYFDKVAIDKVAQKAAELEKQGVQMTVGRYNALRQAAGREALQDLEKTIYTTRRQNRMLYTARAAVAFPTATLNAFYRYGRLAVKNPARAIGFAYNYGRTFQTFGVDKNGNPTKNVDEIAFLIVPGSKEFAPGKFGEGVALNARSLGFMLNMFTPSFISALSVGAITSFAPSTESGIKNALGPLWETWFPYGAPTSLTKSLTPPWVNAAYNAITGDMGKGDYLQSYTAAYNYHKVMIDLGIEKKMPSDSQLHFETKKLWEQKARWAFISPWGVPVKVETNKMDLIDSLYYTYMNKYQKQGLSFEDAKAATEQDMLSTIGMGFFVDRVSFSGKNARVNIPETPEAWDTIFKDNTKLVTKLSNIKKDDIRLVGLLTADLKVNYEDRNTAIAKKLADPNLKLPKSSKLVNALKMTPEEVEILRQKNRIWEEYTTTKAALLSKIPAGKSLRSYPNLQQYLDNKIENEFKKQSPEWYDDYKIAQGGDNAYAYSRAFNLIVKDKKFIDSHLQSKFWQDVVEFNAVRDTWVGIYNSLPDRDIRKAKAKDKYLERIQQLAPGWHPELRRIIDINFDDDTMKVVA